MSLASPPPSTTRRRPRGVVLVIVDGISDVCIPSARPETPLQTASTPALDALASAGQTGLMDPVAPGLACGSDTAHLALFGYEPRACYRGRGALEAAGDGLEVRRGDVAFKCNFAVEEGGVVVKRCAAKGEGFAEMCRTEIERMKIGLVGGGKVEVAVKHAIKHRCAVRLRAEPGMLTDCVSGTDPLVDGEKLKRSVAGDGEGEVAGFTAKVVNEVDFALRGALKRFGELDGRSRDEVKGAIKKIDPDGRVPNVVLLRGASEKIDVHTDFRKKHGMTAFLIAPTKIIAGIGHAIGITVKDVSGATGDYKTNYRNKAKAAVSFMLEQEEGDAERWRYNLGVVHLKAVDDAGHEGHLDKKILHMEKIDGLVRTICEGLVASGRGDVLVAVTGDHTTPLRLKGHSCEPVPFVIAPCAAAGARSYAKSCATGWYSDGARIFDEVDLGEKGSFGRFPGLQLMEIVKHFMFERCSLD